MIIVIKLFLSTTLRATAAPSTYGPGTWGETPIADHPLIQTLGKTWTNLEHQQNNIDVKIDAKSFQEDSRRVQDHYQDGPGPQPLGNCNHGFRVANTPSGEASGELTLLMKVGRRDERDGRKEGREAKGGTVGRAIMCLLIALSSDLLF